MYKYYQNIFIFFMTVILIITYSFEVKSIDLCKDRGLLIWSIPLNTQDIGLDPEEVFLRPEYRLKHPLQDIDNRLHIALSPDGETSIRADAKKGKNNLVSITFEQLEEPGIAHACLSMQVYLSKSFDFATAGTALGWGLWGGIGRNDSGGVPPELQEGWTVRNVTNGRYGSKIYSYHLNRTGIRYINKCFPHGCLFGNTSTSTGPLIPGKWIQINLELKLNDFSKTNGFAKMWIDGELKANYQSLVFRSKENDWLIRGIQFTDMWGGNAKDPKNFSPKNQAIYYKGYELYNLDGDADTCTNSQAGVSRNANGTHGECVVEAFDRNEQVIKAEVAIDVQTLALDDAIKIFNDEEDVIRVLGGGVNPQNEPLSLIEDFVDVVVGVAAPIRPLDNDSAPEGGELTLVGYSLPVLGDLHLAEDKQSFIYKAASAGNDSFVYVVRDNHGRIARSNVNIDIAEVKTTPQPQTDFIQTNKDIPVTFNVLNNDSESDSGNLTIVGFSVPDFGSIKINPDQTLLYTPFAGIEGMDEFTYTVRNSTGGMANARVFITISDTGDTFTNGFSNRRRIVVPRQTDNALAAENHVFLIALTDPDLRSQAEGGRLRSAQGYDLRFETQQGSVLDHDVEALDLTTGELRAWVRLPNWDLTKSVQILLYYDNAAVIQNTANPSAVWQGYLGRWNSTSGMDSSGNSRDLTVKDVAAGELVGPAGDYDGNAVMTLANSTFQSGLSALTVQAIVKADASIVGTNAGILTEGSITGSDSSAGITLQYLASSASGVDNVVHFKARSSDGNAFVLSSGDRHTSEMQVIHGTWKAGEIPKLFLDGEFETSSANSDARTGDTVATGPFFIGTGPRNSAIGGWKGLIDEVRLTNRVLHPLVIASEATNIATPELFYGIGARELPGDQERSVVAVPFRVAVMADDTVNIPVLDETIDPDVGHSFTIDSVGRPSNGNASVIDSLVRYEPNSGFSGTDQFSYSITDGSRTVTGLIKIEVEQPQPQSFDPVLPNGKRVLLLNATAKRTLFASTDTLQSVLNSALPGDHVVLRNGNYSSFSMRRSGTEQDPIVIVAENPQGAVLTGQVSVTGSWLKFDQLAVRGGGHFEAFSPASNLRFDRSVFEDNVNSGIRLWPGVVNVRVSRCVGRNGREFFIYADIDTPAPPGGPQFVHIDHSYFTGYNTKSTIRLGDTSHPNRAFELNAVVEYNYFDTNTGHRELIVGKSSRNWVRHNTIVGGSRGDIAIRQGSYWNVYGNYLIGAGGITVVATDNNVYNNYIASGTRGIWLMSGDNTWDETTDQRPIYDRSERCVIANNTIILSDRTSEGAGIGANFGQINNPATECDIVNNLVLRLSGSAPLISRTVETANRFANNLVSANSGYTGSGVTVANPQLQLSGGVYRPTSNSPTRGVGAEIKSYGPTNLTIVDDIKGGLRGSPFDIGAEQFSTAEPKIPKIEFEDVGVAVIDPYQTD